MKELTNYDLYNEGNDLLISAYIDYSEAGYPDDDSEDELKMELLRTIRSLDAKRRRKIFDDLLKEYNQND